MFKKVAESGSDVDSNSNSNSSSSDSATNGKPKDRSWLAKANIVASNDINEHVSVNALSYLPCDFA